LQEVVHVFTTGFKTVRDILQ